MCIQMKRGIEQIEQINKPNVWYQDQTTVPSSVAVMSNETTSQWEKPRAPLHVSCVIKKVKTDGDFNNIIF